MVPNVERDAADGQFLRPALDTLPINAAVLDSDGAIVATNSAWQAFAEANGVRTDPEMLGVDYLAVVDAADDAHATRAAAGLRGVLREERERFELEYPCHAPDEKRWFLMRAAPFAHDGDRYVTVAHVEITERKARERALQRVSEIIAAPNRSFAQRVDALLAVGREALEMDYATLSYVDDDEYVFEAIETSAEIGVEAGDTIPLETTSCDRVVTTGETLVLEDIERDAPELAARAGNVEMGLSSYLGVPVVLEGETCGTVCFYDTAARTEGFSDWAVAFVELLGNWVSREIERRRYADRFAALGSAFPDLAFVLDTEGQCLDCLAGPTAADGLPVEPEALLGRTLGEVLPADTADLLLATVRDAVTTGRLRTVDYELDVPAGTRWFEGRVAPLPGDEYGPETVVLVARDVTERRARTEKLERQRDELAKLHRINALIREIAHGLQNAATREAIETAVCEHLTESELYQAAWIGTRTHGESNDGAVVPRTVAGVDATYLDGIADTTGPATAALRSGEIQVVNEIGAADAVPAERREVALECDSCAFAAVPLTTGEMTYGVLMVYAPSGHTIDESERDVLVDLGRAIALAVQRVESQRSLTAPTAVELRLRFPEIAAFGEATARLNCELTFERQAPVSDGRSLLYFTVRDADPARLCERLTAAPIVDACTVVRDADRPALVEVAVGEASSSVIDVLIDHGASIAGARVADGEMRVTAEVAPESDVRAIVASLKDATPAVELDSKRLINRPATTGPRNGDRDDDRLTPKQRAALSVAFTRGYYDWPRESTAEEIAETMDISSSTFHYHLRRGIRSLLTAFFEQESHTS